MVFRIFDYLIFRPIMLIMEVSFNMIKGLNLPNYLLLLIFSLLINILILPFYLKADLYQSMANDKENTLKNDIQHIKDNFKGEERLLMLNTLYKQNGYSLFYVLRSSLPLIFELVLFVCSYRFLITTDLSPLDGDLINLFSFKIFLPFSIDINFLPIIMTIINIFSSTIYCANLSKKKKIQLYVVSIFFLIFFYNVRADIVLYWIYNNIFSLIKNIVLRFKFKKENIKLYEDENFHNKNMDRIIFIFSIFNISFYSLFILLNFASASVYDFISFYKDYKNFNFFQLFFYNFLLNIGLFGIWGNILYLILNKKEKGIYEKVVIALTFICLINYLFFSMSKTSFQPNFFIQTYNELKPQIIVIKYLLIATILYVVFRNKYKRFYRSFSHIIVLMIIVIVIISINSIKKIYVGVNNQNNDKSSHIQKTFNLSTKGKNVIIIVLDTAYGKNIPYIFNDKPKLKESYSGFKYYPNVITHGACTDFGLPTVFGGYEYTPIEINKRKNELINNKLIEAYSVLPSIFKNNGYDITMYNMVQLGIHDNQKFLNGLVSSELQINGFIDKESFIKRSCIFSFVFSFPLILQGKFYDYGNYFVSNASQRIISEFEAVGKSKYYIDEYAKLDLINSICKVVDNDTNNYVSVYSCITHSPFTMLQAPDYIMSDYIDNTEYFSKNRKKFIDNKMGFSSDSNELISTVKYCTDMGAMLCLQKLFNFMKLNNVYDNTRIIICSDHGSRYSENFNLNDTAIPLLMVKDFNETDFIEDTTFMTLADIPTISLKGLIDNPVNPFTGKVIDDLDKKNHNQLISNLGTEAIDHESKYLKPCIWYSVHDNIYDINSWEITYDDHFLDTYELPADDRYPLHE